jgi:Leucine-rich repeat (LRR) protein
MALKRQGTQTLKETANPQTMPQTPMFSTLNPEINFLPNRPHLQHLAILRCRGNIVTHIPSEITRLMGLKLFQLDNNKLESIPDEMGYLKVIYEP